MFCIKCGTQLPDQAGFCNSCGTPTGAGIAAPDLPAQPQPPVPHQQPVPPAPDPAQAPAPPKQSAKRGLILALALLVLVAGAAVFFLRGGEDPVEVHTAAVNQTIRSLTRAMNDMDVDAMADLWIPAEARKIRASDNVISSLPLDSGDLVLASVQAGLAFTGTQVAIEPYGGPEFSADFTAATMTARVSLELPLLDSISTDLLFQFELVDEEWLISGWKLAS